MLNVENISISYRKETLLRNLSFTVEAGEAVTLIGLSGSGKTSLLRACANLLKLDHGLIWVAGEPAERGANQVTYLMQEDLLLPWRTVLENIRFFAELGPRKARPAISLERARTMLAEVGLEQAEEYYPDQLSGGMRQRVALARALLQERPLVLLDEPFSALDVIIRENLYILLRRMQKRLGRTLLMVTHDFHDALMLSDRILVLGEQNITGEWRIDEALRASPERMGVLSNELREVLRQHSLI